MFCERCGYSLHGLPQCRCEACTLLHFVCPECNHRQPINTLRPAMLRVIGRVRAMFVVGRVLFKLNFFGWLFFAWFAMGAEWSYDFRYQQVTPMSARSVLLVPRPLEDGVVFAFALFALPFGAVARMLLLRWRRGAWVAATLAVAVAALVEAGGWFRGHVDAPVGSQVGTLGRDFHMLPLIAAGIVALGTMIAWPVWLALVSAFVPTRAGRALLDWQRSLGERMPSPDATRRFDVPNPA